jgi:hypothetical protein
MEEIHGDQESAKSPAASTAFRTFVPDIAPPAGFTFNQFLVLGDEPLMFHTGLRKMFPLNREALSRIIPPERLRWIAYGHFEADECGAMNEWLAVAPQATPAHGQTGCMVSLADFADRDAARSWTARSSTSAAASACASSTRRTRRTAGTPASVRGIDANLMCGDLFTQLGNDTALTDGRRGSA